MTEAQIQAAVLTLNQSLRTLQDLAKLPEQTEASLKRAIEAARAANDICDELAGFIEYSRLIERMKERT